MDPTQPPVDTSTAPRLAEIWAAHRAYLVDVAFRILGSISDAEDIVQDAFTRLFRADLDEINDVRGWLVTVVSRLCIDSLRSARSRREAYTGTSSPEPRPELEQSADPADRVTLDDSVRVALLVVLERLTPAERAAFVLHDVFQFSFDDVGSIVGRSPVACRQLASRARRRVQSESGPARFDIDVAEQRRVAEGFIAACDRGDLDGLMQVLDPGVVGDVDLGPILPAGRRLEGNVRVATNLLRFYGPDTQTTLVSQPVIGAPGVLAFRDRQLIGVLAFRVGDRGINDIHAIADPHKLADIATLLAPDHDVGSPPGEPAS
jgi:RNA polymerase sigma-70 factor (ECF subfamily)